MENMPRLKKDYNDRIIAALKEEFGYKNVMQVPKLEKIVISKGVGAAIADKKLIEYAVDELTQITGQRAVSTISKKDIATFLTFLREQLEYCYNQRGTAKTICIVQHRKKPFDSEIFSSREVFYYPTY